MSLLCLLFPDVLLQLIQAVQQRVSFLYRRSRRRVQPVSRWAMQRHPSGTSVMEPRLTRARLHACRRRAHLLRALHLHQQRCHIVLAGSQAGLLTC